ncbi:MAG: mechanosensitive ion channel family protein [Planctomycetota bacterium]|nr:mechanosensitive ion channel family protein [Planctomycetota bacterium]
MQLKRWLLIRALMCFVLLAPASILVAQDEGAPQTPPPIAVPDAFASPGATLLTFVSAMGKETPDFAQAVLCMDTSQIPAEAANDLAIKLSRCINRIEFIDFEVIGIDVDRLQRRAGENEFRSWTFFPRQVRFFNSRKDDRYQEVKNLVPNASIVLSKQDDGRWLFSTSTLQGIEDLYEQIGQLTTIDESLSSREFQTVSEFVEGFWPAFFIENAFLRIKYWQWLSLLSLIFIGIVLDFTVRFLLVIMTRRMIARRGGEATSQTLKRTVRPFGLTAAALFWLFTLNLLGLPISALAVLVPTVKFFAILAFVWAAYRVTDLIAEVLAGMAEKTESKFDDLLIPLVRKSIKIFITAFGLIYLADSLNIPLAPLLAGIGIGGAGFAFAAKDTLEHFFGSLTVITDRPFQVGDWVVIDGTEGTVESVGFRSTRVRTFYNSLVTIPNGNLVRAVVDNYGLRKYRRWSTHLNLTYDTPPDKIEAFCEGLRELVRLHPYTRKDYYQIWMHELGAHSLDVLLYVFWETPDWQTELRERHRLILDVLRLADRMGIEFAFPTQTLHVYKEDQSAQHHPAQLPAKAIETKAQREGRKSVHEITSNSDWRGGKPEAYVFRGASSKGEEEGDESQIESKAGGDAE